MPDATPEQMDWYNDLQRMSTSGENAAKILRYTGQFNVEPLLPDVAVPTLVLHSRGDAAVPFNLGRQLASKIPGARFVPLDSKNHLIVETEPAWQTCLSEIRRFLNEFS